MIVHESKFRVRYAETDKMGYVYHGNYATYFEVARVEMLRSLGISYKELEDKGIALPVLELKTKFFKPAFYDQEITVKTMIRKMPGVRIVFEYNTFNEEGIQINQGETTLVFVSTETGKPIKAPKELEDVFASYFNE